MGIMDVLKVMFSKNPSAYPPANIDWTKFEPAGVADARSPCPMLNALCNHHILPHDGRKITRDMAVNALMKALNVDGKTSAIFASKAVTLNPDGKLQTFDLNHLHKHGEIEHDVSLSRNDAAFGDNHTFDQEIFAKTLSHYGDAKETSFELQSKVRYERVKAAKAAHEEAGLDFNYGLKEFVLSYGESALILSILGDPEHGKVPIEYIKILFEQARVPYAEGWRKSTTLINQKAIHHIIQNLKAAHPNMAEEYMTMGYSTVTGAERQVSNKISDIGCNVM